MALHSYHDVKGAMPPAAVRGPDGRSLLSWRVLLLPYIEEGALFEEFRLDQPWDSPHNLRLLDRMPSTYRPFRDAPTPQGHTYFQVIVGPGTPFGQREGLKLDAWRGDRSQTFLVVEAGESVPWTKPVDLEYVPEGVLPSLGGIFRNGTFRALHLDASVMDYQLVEPDRIRAAITGRVP